MHVIYDDVMIPDSTSQIPDPNARIRARIRGLFGFGFSSCGSKFHRMILEYIT